MPFLHMHNSSQNFLHYVCNASVCNFVLDNTHCGRIDLSQCLRSFASIVFPLKKEIFSHKLGSLVLFCESRSQILGPMHI